jgi:hypothetical protein
MSETRPATPMALTDYRNSEREQQRTRDLMRLMPGNGRLALDVGTRDAYMSQLLAERFDRVVALDLVKPVVNHPRIDAIVGDASNLSFRDDAFDAVLCAEVLEHIPPRLLDQVCREVARVTRCVAVIGVPYRQDLRLGRAVCRACGANNPAWGHVNSFDEAKLLRLFPGMRASFSFIGRTDAVTNGLSARLMNFAGNPYGTYEQDEGCIECGALLLPPKSRSRTQRLATRLACRLDSVQQLVTPFRANWIHVRFEKIAPSHRSCE